MNEYKLSDQTLRILDIRKKVEIPDVSTASKDEIKDYNNKSFKKNLSFYRLYRPVKIGINVTRYIIPVEGGDSVSGILVRRSRPRLTDPASIIVYLHDGGWVKGNLEVTEAICTNICNITGALVLAVDYRLAPDFKFPIPAEDCYSSFLWAYQGARYWKADPTQIYLMGSGAGANLAIAAARMLRDRKGPSPAGLILFDPIADCRMRTESHITYASNPTLTGNELKYCIENYQSESKNILDPLFSPLVAKDNSRLPQTLIFASEYDPLFDDAKLFSETLADADVPVQFIENQNKLHYCMDYPKEELWREKMLCVADVVRGANVKNVKVLTMKERMLFERNRVFLIQ